MKKLFIMLGIVCCILCVSITIQAQNITKGYKAVELSGGFDPESSSGAEFSVDGFYGYFIQDYIMLGGGMGFYIDDDKTAVQIYGGARKMFPIGGRLVPFAGVQLGFLNMHFEADVPINYYGYYRTQEISETLTAIIFGFQGGASYFINENASIDTTLNIQFATDDVYAGDDGLKNSDIALKLGVSFYF